MDTEEQEAVRQLRQSHPEADLAYDIKKFMECSTSNFWSESYRQLNHAGNGVIQLSVV